MTLCIYAVIATPARPIRGLGIKGERLRIVRSGTIAAVFGELPRAPAATRRQLQRYSTVVDGIASQSAALLPARFATCFDSVDELELVLRTRASSFRRALRAVRGRVQMTLRVAAPPAGAPEVPGSSRATGRRSPAIAPPSGGRRGTAYLQARADAEAQSRRVPGLESVQAAVRRWVRDERVDKRERLTTVYHLVPAGSADRYRAVLERATVAAGVHVMISGPWPPYAFTDW